MPIDDALKLVMTYGSADHPNAYPYRIAQICAIQHLRIASSSA